MKRFALIPALLSLASMVQADACHDRFTALLVEGNDKMGPTLIHITQEIVGGETSLTDHHSDGDGNGMSEAIDPANHPWSLFVGDKMYMSNDKGATWSFLSTFDSESARENNKIATAKDALTARDLSCGEETLNGIVHEVTEGTYTSSVIAGADIYEKLWVVPKTRWISKSYRHVMMDSFESKTTQVIETHPNLDLPNPE